MIYGLLLVYIQNNFLTFFEVIAQTVDERLVEHLEEHSEERAIDKIN